MGRIRHTRFGRFISALQVPVSGSRYLRLRCSKEGKVATAKILRMYLKNAGVDVAEVEEDIIMSATAPVNRKRKFKKRDGDKKREHLEWNVDEADSKVNGKRCVGSKLGAGSMVLVMDSGCKPINSDYCESFVDGKREEKKCEDLHGHGSHVAGTVAHPVWGVAPHASVGCSRVLGADGHGSISGIIEAIEDAVEYAKTLSRPLIINMSLGGALSDILNHAVRDAAKRGVYFAIAAGNWNIDAKYSSPASVAAPNRKHIFVVGAHDVDGKAADFTNYGEKVSISAGGVDIKSSGIHGGARIDSGTSMATPAVAGAMAVLQSDKKAISHNTLASRKKTVVYHDGAKVDVLSYDC